MIGHICDYTCCGRRATYTAERVGPSVPKDRQRLDYCTDHVGDMLRVLTQTTTVDKVIIRRVGAM